MGASAKKLVSAFIGQAQQADPAIRPRILRRAAATFAQLASDPRNVRAKKHLTSIGLEFAGAAHQAATTNDFTQLLRDTAKAYEELGPAAEFDTHATMDATALQHLDEAKNAMRTSIQPASLNKDSTLGRSATIKFQPSADEVVKGIVQEQTVAFWQGQKEEAQSMTVDIGTVLQPQPTPRLLVTPDARAYAKIQYGSDGNTQNMAVVDLGLGRRITVVGNYVAVIVGMDPPGTPDPPPAEAVAASLTVGASIGTFAAPSQAPLVRTSYIDDYERQEPGIFISSERPIPLRAVRVLVPTGQAATPGDPALPVVTIQFYNLNGNTVTSHTFNLLTGVGCYPITVPPDAFFFQVFTTLGTFLRVPFELSL